MFSFSGFLLFGKTFQTHCYPAILCPHSRRGERLSRVPEFSIDLLSGSVRTTIIRRVSRYNGHLPADGLRNNRIRLNRLANAYYFGETS